MKKRSILLFCMGLFAAFIPFTPVQAKAPHIIDENGVLSEEDKSALEELAQSFEDTWQIDVDVVFTKTMNGYSESAYAEYTYYNYTLGYGDGHSGVLLAVAVEDRYYDTFSYGAAGDVFTTSVLDQLGNDVLEDFRDNKWANGAFTYLNACGNVLSEGNYHYYEPEYTDPEIDRRIAETTPKQRMDEFLHLLPIAGLAAVTLSLIINFLRRRKLRNTGLQNSAAPYATSGLNLSVSQDYFTGKTRSVQHIDRSSGSGGSSSGYHSSGGTHSSGGHHF